MNIFSHMMTIVLTLILSACAGSSLQLSAADDEERDIGLGGTGMLAGFDRGLGGTGVVGEITGFGSIFVNGIEIEYHEGTPVTVDGEEVEVPALQIGDVVEILTTDSSKHTQAIRINLRHEVIGKVTSVDENGSSFTVSGQVVTMQDGAGQLPEPGDPVAVSGIRIDETHIHATRVIPAEGSRKLLRHSVELPYGNEVDRWLIQTGVDAGHVSFYIEGKHQVVPLSGENANRESRGGGEIIELRRSESGGLVIEQVVDHVKMQRGRQIILPDAVPGGIRAPERKQLRSPGTFTPPGPGATKTISPSKMKYGYN